ncbi:MAG: LptA/OstA family protein [Armatimonadota bacterium]|nr:LptA/OstA family protein [Armatimonadota bacterium]
MRNWRAAIPSALALTCIAVLAWGVHRLQQIDPFARLNPLYADAGMGNVLVRFTQVEVRARQLQQPLWQVRVHRADLSRDRQRWLLEGVQEAVLYDDGQPAWRLRAARAAYEGASRLLQVSEAHLQGNPVRLYCSQATWRDQTRELQCLGIIRGTLRDGEFTAQSVRYLGGERRLVAEEVRLVMRTSWEPIAFLQTEPPKESANARQPRTRRVEIEFKRLEEQQGKTRIGEGLTIRDGDTLMTADRAEQDIEAQVIRATGNLRVTDPRVDLTADRLIIELKEKRAVLEGNVQIFVKPKEPQEASAQAPEEETRSLKTEMREPVQITCDRAENLYQKKVITLTGNLKMVQVLKENGKTRTLTAQKAVYNSRTEQVQLIGEVRGVDEKGQELIAPEILVSVKEGDEWLRINQPGRMVILVEEEEETEEPPAPPPPQQTQR